MRVRKQLEFDRVWRGPLFAADHVLVIKAARTGPANPARLGLSVGRKHGNAVIRNRWKRLIREAFRRNAARLPTGFDFVIRPQDGARQMLADVDAALVRLVDRIARKATNKK